jgi:hypothetical protein
LRKEERVDGGIETLDLVATFNGVVKLERQDSSRRSRVFKKPVPYAKKLNAPLVGDAKATSEKNI